MNPSPLRSRPPKCSALAALNSSRVPTTSASPSALSTLSHGRSLNWRDCAIDGSVELPVSPAHATSELLRPRGYKFIAGHDTVSVAIRAIEHRTRTFATLGQGRTGGQYGQHADNYMNTHKNHLTLCD